MTTDGAAAAIAKASVQRMAELQASAAAPKVTASEAKFSRKKARHRSSEGKEGGAFLVSFCCVLKKTILKT